IYNCFKRERINIKKVLKAKVWNSQVYTYKPQRIIKNIKRVTAVLEINNNKIYYKAFLANNTSDPFFIKVVKEEKESKVLEVPKEKTILIFIKKAGLEIDNSCKIRNCSSYKVLIKERKVKHKGSTLTREKKAEGSMLSCVSKGVRKLKIK
ncbi:hypothetical protein DL98DRAFT_437439, partial [Cadophora sp. DSE1049]